MNDATPGMHATEEADPIDDETDTDVRAKISNGDMPDELESSAMGGSERIGGRP